MKTRHTANTARCGRCHKFLPRGAWKARTPPDFCTCDLAAPAEVEAARRRREKGPPR